MTDTHYPKPQVVEFALGGLIWTEGMIKIYDHLSGYLLSFSGVDWCAGIEGGVGAGELYSDPMPNGKTKIRVDAYTLHAGPGGSYIGLGPRVNGKGSIGEFWTGGGGFGACAVTGDWDIKTMAITNLKNRPDNLVNYLFNREYEPSEGTAAADVFTFSDSLMYGEIHAPIIKDFNKDDGDHIAFDGSAKDGITSREDMNFKVVNSKKQLEEASEQDYDFIYFQRKGFLYHDKSPKIGGFGDGGLLAILDGSPDMDSSSLYLHL